MNIIKLYQVIVNTHSKRVTIIHIYSDTYDPYIATYMPIHSQMHSQIHTYIYSDLLDILQISQRIHAMETFINKMLFRMVCFQIIN